MFEEELRELSLPQEFKKIFIAIAAASFFAALIELFFLSLPFEYSLALFFYTIAFPPILFYFLLEYLREKKQKEIESFLPQALMQIASFPKHASMEKIISSIADSNYGKLSKEFSRVRAQARSGASIPRAFQEMRSRNSSPLFNHVIKLLNEAYSSGADLTTAFKEIAENVLDLQAIARESSSAATLQKYTLLFGGALLVPFILGLLLNVVSVLDVSSDSFADFFASAENKTEIRNAVVFGAQAYLSIFCIVASYFIASIEGSVRKAILYLALMLPLALIVFNVVKNAGGII